MTHYLQSNPKFKSTEYWDGFDIYDREYFDAVPPRTEFIHLNKRQYNNAREALILAQQEVKKGGSVDVRYQSGREFNPNEGQLEDGSVVIIDQEEISRWSYADTTRSWEDRGHLEKITPPITRPFSEYWASTRCYNPVDYDDQPNSTGSEQLTYWKDTMIYSRHLIWGVLVTLEKQRRAIQKFSFNGRRNGEVDIYSRYLAPTAVMTLPIDIGEVKPKSLPLTFPLLSPEVTTIIDSLERVRGIDVVYAAAGEKQTKSSRVRTKKIFLPRFSGA